MENRKIKHSYEGMQQDTSKSKFPNNFYFEGRNIRINSTDSQSTTAIANEKGNSLILTIPIPTIDYDAKIISYNDKTLSYTNDEIDYGNQSGDQVIIGHSNSRNYIVLFTTDNNGFDCIWKLTYDTYDLTLLYLRNLGFSINNPIQTINNFENKKIDKIYWVDGKHQMRFLNLEHSIINGDSGELIDINSNIITATGDFELTQPIVTDIQSGGIHTAGMIQYAYNLYIVNGSQTQISPLSELISLDKGVGFGGGAVNEFVNQIPVVNISLLDDNYTNIKLYAIKYTSLNQSPSISLIADRAIVGLTEFIYYDDGNIIQSVSSEEFLFLGSNLIIPKHINSKFNRMFFANYTEKNFDVDVSDPNTIDFRAFSFNSSGISTVYNNITEDISNILVGTEPININNTFTILPSSTHSSSNIDFDNYCFQSNGTIVGGEGKFLKYELVRNQIGIDGFTIEDSKKQFFKDNEIYRIGIQFYNKFGQNSTPKWVNDLKIIVNGNESNLNDFYAGYKIEFKSEFYIWLNNNSNFLDENNVYDDSLKPIGYRLLRSERNINDRTILCQGLLNGMMSITTGSDPLEEDGDIILKERGEDGLKIPSLMRRFDYYLSPMRKTTNYSKVSSWHPTHPNCTNSGDRQAREIQANNAGPLYFTTVQYTKLIQMFSPEIMFNDINNINTTELTVVGRILNDENRVWLREKELSTGNTIETLKINTAINKFDIKASGNESEVSNYDATGLQYLGLISHTNDTTTAGFTQFYRSYSGDIINSRTRYDIYKKPLIVEKGQGQTTYNNDVPFRFINSLEPLATDGGDSGDDSEKLNTVLSWGCKNSTFVLKGSHAAETINAIGNTTYFEDLYVDAGGVPYTGSGNNGEDHHGIIAEYTIPHNTIYTGNIYGGNSYESKRRSNYLEFGDYNEITTSVYNCFSPGDTFVDNFKFTKLVKTDTVLSSHDQSQITEIVNVKLETVIDIKNRNDLSIENWDNKFQPSYEDYTKYNSVYSQQPTLIERRNLDYNFKLNNSFDTNIISSKLKSAGELIDSWTDLLTNEVLTLDGKHGTINSLVNFNDELYTIQDKALAFISISPRVQVQGSDGLAIELGTGQVLDQYKYISTNSGTLNKWSVIPTSIGIYYYDLLNKSFMVFSGQIGSLSDIKGMHSYFTTNTELEDLKTDNPLIKQGISSGFDQINDDIFMTFHKEDESFTISYNEKRNQFISFYDYLPSIYISKGQYFITTNPDLKSIYRQYEGNYNNFYGINYPSYVILNVNPESDLDTVFDNIMYKSEVYLNDIDQPDKTLTKVRLYSEYQDSGLIPLTVGRNSNLRRKFRDWNAILPRNQGSRERIRNPWVKLLLQFDNTSNYKLILHDIVLSYSV